MKLSFNAIPVERYVALDIHKEYVMVGGMNAAQEWVIRPQRVEMERLCAWAAANLLAGGRGLGLGAGFRLGVEKKLRKSGRIPPVRCALCWLAFVEKTSRQSNGISEI